jgi:hypothetical protein
MKEKNKKCGIWTWPSSSLSGGNNLPCSAEMQQALIFWPFRLLVLRAMATLRPLHLCAVEDRRYGHLDLR